MRILDDIAERFDHEAAEAKSRRALGGYAKEYVWRHAAEIVREIRDAGYAESLAAAGY